jgi:hypothetical protein
MKKVFSILSNNYFIFFILFFLCIKVNAQTITINGPAGSEKFGLKVYTLPNGNFVVTDYLYDDGALVDVGAVYLYNGITKQLISTLKGEKVGDAIGFGGIEILKNGNFLVKSIGWQNGASAPAAGAITWVSATAGLNGTVNATNSLVGTKLSDNIGGSGIIKLPNGNYIVRSKLCDNGGIVNAGAFTFCNGNGGTNGFVSTSNSLMGSSDFDLLGDNANENFGDSTVKILANGNFVLISPEWDNGAIVDAGAVTWVNGNTGIVGTINAANSLVGVATNDQVGIGSVKPLTNGNYVVNSWKWANAGIANCGAVTLCNGATGLVGNITTTNSLVGASANDFVGREGIFALPNGNYVVNSARYFSNSGAITYCSGTTPLTGNITTTNSLIGQVNDKIGNGGITVLPNGNYVVSSTFWNFSKGAVAFCNGTTGKTIDNLQIGITNSLTGVQTNDNISSSGIVALPNSNYVVKSPAFARGALQNAGALTLCNGSTGGTVGNVTDVNSILGFAANDKVGSGEVTILANGNFVSTHSFWADGAKLEVGAVTWRSSVIPAAGASPTSGYLSVSNALIGNKAFDNLGKYVGGLFSPQRKSVSALPNGNYVVCSPAWSNGATAAVGAVTWGNGVTGTNGVVSAANSLIGSTASDLVGNDGIAVLENSNYVVSSKAWNAGAITAVGAITFCPGNAPYPAVVGIANSVIGSQTSANVGSVLAYDVELGREEDAVLPIPNNNYMLTGIGTQLTTYNYGVAIANAATGIKGYLNNCNSVIETHAFSNYIPSRSYNAINKYLIVGRYNENKVVIFKSAGQGLSPINTTANNTFAGAGTATFVDNNCYLVAEVKTAGALPINGVVNAKVWLETTQPTQYVKRHYEITPTTNTTTATAKVTLYFTQQEFNDFNAVSAIDLPTAANDNVGIANLLIEKRNGISSNGTGLPNTYAGAITTINPADVDVVWNVEDSRWEISFDVTGFSGFFVKTTLGVLPIQWLQVQGKLLSNKLAQINWKLAENNIAYYEIEHQTTANIFEKIGTITSKGNGENEYSFTDSKILVGTGLYRIKQRSLDGKISYSSIVKLSATNDKQIQVYPNPVEDILTVTINQTNIKNATAQLLTIDGKMITTQKVSSQVFIINTSNLKTGVYVLKMISDTEVFTQRIVKK